MSGRQKVVWDPKLKTYIGANSVYDNVQWKNVSSKELHRRCTVANYKENGYAVLTLSPEAQSIAIKFRQLFETHKVWLWDKCGGCEIFNTIEEDVRSQLLASNEFMEKSVDRGRGMMTQVLLEQGKKADGTKAKLTKKEDGIRLELVALLRKFTLVLQGQIKTALNLSSTDPFLGSIFSILRSLPGIRHQVPHCDVDYNNKHYKRNEVLVLASFQDDTAVRVIPKSHDFDTLDDIGPTIPSGRVLLLAKFDVLIMHPKLFHSGGASSVYNMRLHFYFGFGDAVDSNNAIFDATHYVPIEAIENAIAPRTAIVNHKKRQRKEAMEARMVGLKNQRR